MSDELKKEADEEQTENTTAESATAANEDAYLGDKDIGEGPPADTTAAESMISNDGTDSNRMTKIESDSAPDEIGIHEAKDGNAVVGTSENADGANVAAKAEVDEAQKPTISIVAQANPDGEAPADDETRIMSEQLISENNVKASEEDSKFDDAVEEAQTAAENEQNEGDSKTAVAVAYKQEDDTNNEGETKEESKDSDTEAEAIWEPAEADVLSGRGASVNCKMLTLMFLNLRR